MAAAQTQYDEPHRPRRPDELMVEATDIIEAARTRDVTLRLTGGLAVRRYCTDLAFVQRDHSDIDLMGLSSQIARLQRLFMELGYVENTYVSQATANAQLQFLPPAAVGHIRAQAIRGRLAGAGSSAGVAEGDHIDVFVDVMRMDHDIDVRDRLGIDRYAVSPVDILAVKLQIGEPAEKDIHDIVALLKDVPLSDRDDDASIHVMRLARLCARDWGLYFDVTRSLKTTLAMLDRYGLDAAERDTVVRRAGVVRAAIDAATKSLRWRVRARVGTRLPWRREIEEREGTPTAA